MFFKKICILTLTNLNPFFTPMAGAKSIPSLWQEPEQPKALFRRAKALLALKEHQALGSWALLGEFLEVPKSWGGYFMGKSQKIAKNDENWEYPPMNERKLELIGILIGILV
jgi:hypothetical protein